VDGQVDFKVELAVSKGRMKLGLGITSCRKVPLALFVCVFRKETSALGPLFYWTFGTFKPFLDPYFLGVFKGEFCIFFGLFKKLHLRDFKTL